MKMQALNKSQRIAIITHDTCDGFAVILIGSKNILDNTLVKTVLKTPRLYHPDNRNRCVNIGLDFVLWFAFNKREYV